MDTQISFLVATHNRGQVLVDCLRRLGSCGLPSGAVEIIVVDNASTDGTAELVARELPGVRLIRLEKNRGPVAKNYALKEARGEFVVFLDDDAYPLPGAVPQMVRHFRADARLGAAVFDVTLPEGQKECAAYPDVFIGAGTGFRRDVVTRLGGLPQEFFMQAEEYDLSLRMLAAGLKIQRFADMPLVHLKTPGSRVATRTTRLDVRNNLYVLAKYVPAPLCFALASDWLSRYFLMALTRDAADLPAGGETHKAAYLRGSAEGMAKWAERRGDGRHLLSENVIEQVFRLEDVEERMRRAQTRLGFERVLFADFGKNIFAYHRAAEALGVEVVAIADDFLSGPGGRRYRGIPIMGWEAAKELAFDAVIVSNLSPVHAERRAAALRRVCRRNVVHLHETAVGRMVVAGGEARVEAAVRGAEFFTG